MTIALIIIMVVACGSVVFGFFSSEDSGMFLGFLFGIFLLLLGILIKLAFSN